MKTEKATVSQTDKHRLTAALTCQDDHVHSPEDAHDPPDHDNGCQYLDQGCGHVEPEHAAHASLRDQLTASAAQHRERWDEGACGTKPAEHLVTKVNKKTINTLFKFSFGGFEFGHRDVGLSLSHRSISLRVFFPERKKKKPGGDCHPAQFDFFRQTSDFTIE